MPAHVPSLRPALRARLALLAALALPLGSHAEAPMVTDDAGTLDKGGVKVELEWAREGQVRGPNLALAYAPIEHLEAEIALASAHDHGTSPATPSHARGLALKWVPLHWGETSAGLKFDTRRDTTSGSGSTRDTEVQALLTHQYAAGVVLHANLGRARSKDSSGTTGHATTWALGGELPLVEAVQLVGDVYGDSHSPLGRQIGVRWTLQEGLKLSAALGRQNHENQVRSVLTWEF